MGSIIGILRIAAVVGLSAIKIASTCLRVKEAKEQGIAHPFRSVISNSVPCYNQPINNACNSVNMSQCNSDFRWRNEAFDGSRRYVASSYVPTQPVQVVQPVMSQPVNNMCYSATNTPVYNQPVMMTYRWHTTPSYQQTPVVYPQNQWNKPYPELQWKNESLGSQFNYAQQYQTLPIVNMPYINQPRYGYMNELKWRDTPYQMNYGYGRYFIPSYENERWLRRQSPGDNSGIVAMFYTDNGVPLMGPQTGIA